MPLSEVLSALQQLPAADAEQAFAPYLEVRVLLEGPEPALRHKIETVLTGKKVRLAKIDVRYPFSTASGDTPELITQDKLHELQPLDVFIRIYQSKYSTPVPEEMLQLFNKVAQEVNPKEN